MMYLIQDGYMSHIRYSNMTSLDKWTFPQWRLIAGGNGGFCRVNPYWRPLEGKDKNAVRILIIMRAEGFV